jgi:hypothetical protein
LVVATLVKAAQVKPDLRNVRVDADSTRVRIKSVTELVDLEVKDTNRTPKGGVTAISVNRLLVGFVRLIVLLTGHVCTAEEVPALSVRRVSFQTLSQVLDGKLLVLKRRSILVIQPPQLL